MAEHVEAHSPEEVQRHVRTYIIVFVSLAALTLITVSVSTLHTSPFMHVALALFIAVIKGSLVAAYFMHLISERKLIYWVLCLTVVFFAAMLFIPMLSNMNQIHLTHYVP